MVATPHFNSTDDALSSGMMMLATSVSRIGRLEKPDYARDSQPLLVSCIFQVCAEAFNYQVEMRKQRVPQSLACCSPAKFLPTSNILAFKSATCIRTTGDMCILQLTVNAVTT